jgi:hypothetical protein
MSLKEERMNQITGVKTTRVSANSAEVRITDAVEGGRLEDADVQVDLDFVGDLPRFKILIPHLAFYPRES